LACLVPCCHGVFGYGTHGRVVVVEVVDPWFGFLEEFSCSVAEELVDADLYFERRIAEGAIEGVVLGADERDGFVGGFGAEDVAE